MLILRKPWDSQPQEAAEFNQADSLGSILKYAWVPSVRMNTDIGSGIVATLPADSYIKAGPNGMLLQNDAGTASSLVVLPETGNFPMTICAQMLIQVAAPGNYPISIDNSGGGSLVRLECGSGTFVGLTVRNNFGTSRSISVSLPTTINTTLSIIAVVYSNTDYRVFVNGLQTNGTADFGTGVAWNRLLIGSGMKGGFSVAGYAPGKTISDAEALRITSNPSAIWNAFAPRTIYIPVAAAAGGGTHTTTGTLVGPGSTITGAAAHPHTTTGTLVGPGSTIAGAAVRSAPGTHTTTGVLVGQGSIVTGTAVHPHTTTGVLVGSSSVVAGTAARSAVVVHTTTGVLVGQGSVINGSAAGPSTGPAQVTVGGWLDYGKKKKPVELAEIEANAALELANAELKEAEKVLLQVKLSRKPESKQVVKLQQKVQRLKAARQVRRKREELLLVMM